MNKPRLVAWYVTYEYRPRQDCLWAKRDACFSLDIMEKHIALMKLYPDTYRNISEPIGLVRVDQIDG